MPMTVSQDRIFISGELTFTTVAALLSLSQKLFPRQGSWRCDFSQVGHCDSAGLALVLEWLKLARQRKITVQFDHFPQQLQSIAAPAGLSALLKDALNHS